MGEKRNRLIIALSGKKGSGKSTVSRFLVQQHGFKWLSYAAPGRQMLKALGLGDVDFLPENKEEPIAWLSGVREVTPRYLMQTLLSAWGREQVHPDLWAFVVGQKILKCEGDVVIDDLRFNNEAELLLHTFGKEQVRIIKLVRPGLRSNHLSQHVSENGVNDALIHNTIVNDTTPARLCTKVLDALQISGPAKGFASSALPLNRKFARSRDNDRVEL